MVFFQAEKGGSGGVNNYPDLTNKPQINGVELDGNKTAAQFGLQPTINILPISNGGTGNSSGYIRTGQKSGTSIGDKATAEGYITTASGFVSHAEGFSTTASGSYSHAEGDDTTASGYASHSEGTGTVAGDGAQCAIGRYNVVYNNYPNTGGGTYGQAFIIGNGDVNGTRSNAFRVSFAGEVYGKSSYNSSGADYAEFFEWADSNPNNDDRIGYFVTLNNDKIKIANPGDYILGIISGNPSVVGNGDEDWMARLIRDDFGRPIKIKKEIEIKKPIMVKSEDGSDLIEYVKEIQEIETYLENENYDSTKKYIERKCRPEWDYVCMIGMISVRDDGTCDVNGYCNVSSNGIATKSDKGYRVIKRISDNVIKIIFK